MAGAVVKDKVVESLEYVGNRELAKRFKHGRDRVCLISFSDCKVETAGSGGYGGKAVL